MEQQGGLRQSYPDEESGPTEEPSDTCSDCYRGHPSDAPCPHRIANVIAGVTGGLTYQAWTTLQKPDREWLDKNGGAVNVVEILEEYLAEEYLGDKLVDSR